MVIEFYLSQCVNMVGVFNISFCYIIFMFKFIKASICFPNIILGLIIITNIKLQLASAEFFVSTFKTPVLFRFNLNCFMIVEPCYHLTWYHSCL